MTHSPRPIGPALTAVPMATPAPRPRRAAFTLIELLVVIGILLVLISLAVIGFRTVGNSAKTRLTRNQLENCKSLQAAYQETNAPETLMPIGVTSGLPVPLVASSHWRAAPNAGVDNASTCLADASASDNLEEDTARVLARLRSVPKNRESLDKMAPERIKRTAAATLLNVSYAVSPGNTATDSVAAQPAGLVVLDGFNGTARGQDVSGRPIYFVPGGGLINVTTGGVASTATSPLRAPNRQAFWVSPGPDGDLTTGDDNMYSFDN